MDNLLEIIEKNKEIKDYFRFEAIEKNKTLFNEGEECKILCVVKYGEINIASYLKSGQEIIYNKINKGKSFGGNLIFSSEPFYRGDVISKEDTGAYIINKEGLIKLLEDNETFLLAFLKTQSDFAKELNFKIKLLTFNNAKDRFMYYMNFHNDQIKYKSISELAKELNLSREVLSRLIHKLASEGTIELGRGSIKIKNSR